MSTTGARYGSKIYSTVDAGAPYRWKLGDGSTIPGLEEAVSSMSPGGIRRLIIPAKLAYGAKGSADECVDGKGLGPRPSITEAVGEFQRFKNIYCESLCAYPWTALSHEYHLSLTLVHSRLSRQP